MILHNRQESKHLKCWKYSKTLALLSLTSGVVKNPTLDFNTCMFMSVCSSLLNVNLLFAKTNQHILAYYCSTQKSLVSLHCDIFFLEWVGNSLNSTHHEFECWVLQLDSLAISKKRFTKMKRKQAWGQHAEICSAPHVSLSSSQPNWCSCAVIIKGLFVPQLDSFNFLWEQDEKYSPR